MVKPLEAVGIGFLALFAPRITDAEATVLRSVERDVPVHLGTRAFLRAVTLLELRDLIERRGCVLALTRRGCAALLRHEIMVGQ